MKERCPKCGNTISLAEVEGWTPLVRKGYAFDCSNCGSKLVVNYWSGKTNLFRLLFIVGAVVIILGLTNLGLSMWVTYSIAAGYVVGGWIVLRRIREIILL